MKNLVVIGARGFGREVFYQASANLDPEEIAFKGYLDDKGDALDGYKGYPPILSSVEDYVVEKDDVFFCALGDPDYRKRYVDIIKSKGGKFISIISKKAEIAHNVKVGEGTIIYSFVCVASDVTIGNFCNIGASTTLGHDTKIGDYVEIESHANLCGFVEVNDDATIHTAATIVPHVKIGKKATVGAGSIVLKDVADATVVFGNPARAFMNKK